MFGHSRKTSKQCRLYRAPAPQSPAGDAASIAGAVPAAAGVEAWTLNDNAGALRLVMYNEFRSSVFDQQAQKHLKEVVANLRQHHIWDDASVADVFELIVGTSLDGLRINVNSALRLDNPRAPPVTSAGFSQFMMYAYLGLSKDLCDTFLRGMALAASPRIELRSRGRFVDRTDDTPHVWRWCRSALRKTAEVALTTSSHLTIDDWLSGLRALDFQVKHKSDRCVCNRTTTPPPPPPTPPPPPRHRRHHATAATTTTTTTTTTATTTTTSTAAAAAAATAKWTTPPSVPTLPAKFPGLESLSIKKREQLFLYHAFKPVAAGAPFVRKAGKA